MNNIGHKIQEELKLYKRTIKHPEDNLPHDVDRALKYIHENLFESNLTVSFLKKKCRIFNNNFSTKFRHYVGLPPKKYYMKHRLKIGKSLLKSKDYKDTPIITIALNIGFQSHSAFSKAIKNEFELSPKELKCKS